MNIWLINHHANPPHEPGDARHYSHARELIRRGHQAHVIACNFDHLKHRYLPMASGRLWEHQVHSQVPFTWIPACPYRTNFEIARIRNMFEFAYRVWKAEWAESLPAPDLVLGSTPDPFAALAAERLASRYRAPFVLEVRDLWPFVFVEVGGYSPYHPFVQLVDKVMRYLYARAARIIMFSESAELLVRSGAPRHKIVCIPHGVDLAMNPEPGAPPEDGMFTITYLGAHNQWNSLHAVLDAARLLQQRGVHNVVFRFVGDGVSKPELMQKATAEGIHNVRFEDPVPKTEVPEIKRTSDAFIINNRKDSVSRGWMSFNKLYDYLAAARPVVFGSCSASDPVRESGAGISVDADDPEAMAAAVEFLAGQTPEQLLEYGARGRRFVEQNYSIPALVDRFESFAQELTGLPAGMAAPVCVGSSS